MRRAAFLALAGLVLTAATAAADRAPTRSERAAIVSVVRTHLRLNSRPAARRCTVIAPRISLRSQAYAVAREKAATRVCSKYLGNGFQLLRHRAGRWRVIYDGSDPPCEGVAPEKVVLELIHLVPRSC